LPAAVVVLVAVLASIPVRPSPPAAALAHVILYAAVAAALLAAWRGLGWPHPRIGAAAAAITLGALHEVAQALMPWRSGALRDLAPGAVGVVIVMTGDWARERRALAALTPPALVAGWILLVTAGRVAPGSPLLSGSVRYQIIAYGLLTALLLIGWRRAAWPRPALSAFALTVAWAVVIQGLHGFISYRPVSLAAAALAAAAAGAAALAGAVAGALLPTRAAPGPPPARTGAGRPDRPEVQ
jgi:hypothetical protein